MRSMRWYHRGLHAAAVGAAALLIAWGGNALAQPSPVTVEIDENGNGTATGIPGMPGAVALPFFGGVGTTDPLTYNLSVLTGSLQPGTLLITEGCSLVDDEEYCVISDVIRFLNVLIEDVQTPFLQFYSDNSDGVDALADTGLPFVGTTTGEILTCGTRSALAECFLPEVGPEGNNGVTYTPIRLTGGGPPYTDPGFFTSHGVTFIIHSDTPAAAPEPATLALLGVGLAALGFAGRRKPTK